MRFCFFCKGSGKRPWHCTGTVDGLCGVASVNIALGLLCHFLTASTPTEQMTHCKTSLISAITRVEYVERLCCIEATLWLVTVQQSSEQFEVKLLRNSTKCPLRCLCNLTAKNNLLNTLVFIK